MTELNELELVNVSGGDGILPGGNGILPGGNGSSTSYFTYVIKKGDCLSVIAQRYNTTVATLQSINNISNPNLICEGHKLLIPYSN